MNKINKYLVNKHVTRRNEKISSLYDDIMNIAYVSYSDSDGMYINSRFDKDILDIYDKFMQNASTDNKLELLDILYKPALYNGECLLQGIAKVVADNTEDTAKEKRLNILAGNEDVNY